MTLQAFETLVLIGLNDLLLKVDLPIFSPKSHAADPRQSDSESCSHMSSVSVRFFIITDDSEIFRVSINKFERLLKCSDEEKIERFAGQRVRVAEIGVRLENRKPIEVIRAIYYYLHFNEKGILDEDSLIKSRNIVSTAGISSIFIEKEQGNVINAQQEFAKRQRDHAVWWKPNMQLERNILDASIDEFKCKRL